MNFRRVLRLKPGNRVAILSPSATVPSRFPEVARRGIENLREYFDLDPVILPGAFEDTQRNYENPGIRVADLVRAFSDDDLRGIFATIGGDESIRVLPLLDRKLLVSNTKSFMGYSDCCTYHTYLATLGNCSLHGPAIMAGFAQIESLPVSYVEYISRVLFSDSTGLEMNAFDEYSNGYPDWGAPGNATRVNAKVSSDPWKWLQGTSIRGRLFAGNVEVLDWIRGTEFWPPPEFWNGVFLILETSEEVPQPVAVERYLRSYGISGILHRIGGLAFGRFRGYSREMIHEVEKRIMSVVRVEFHLNDLPVVTGLDVGHTDPQFPIPNGVNGEIRQGEDVLRILGSYTNP